MSEVNLSGLKMCVKRTDAASVINEETMFRFSQADDVVTAEYSGGAVTRGFLVGLLQQGELRFRYCQLHADGELAGGESRCRVETVDGRVRIVERYQWSDGRTGENVFEEV